MGSTIVLGYDGSACANAALTAAVESAKAHGDGIVVAFGAGAHAVGEDSDQRNLAHTMGRDWAEEAISAIRAQGVEDARASSWMRVRPRRCSRWRASATRA
jgi:hypothetical protein